MIKNNALNKILIIDVQYIFYLLEVYFSLKGINYEFMFYKTYYITSGFDEFPFLF